MTVVVGVDGAGRTHRLGEIAAAAATPVIRIDGGAGADPDLVARLDPAAGGGSAAESGVEGGGALVVVDDAHRLPAGALRTLAAAARRGVPMAIARRPGIDRPELAELDEAVAGQGTVELLAPLDDDGVAAVVAAATGRPAALERIAPVREASAGLPALAAAIAAGPLDAPSPVLIARMQQRLAVLEPPYADLARTLALGLDLSDEVLAAAAGLGAPRLAPAIRSLRDCGMLVPDGERVIPAVALALLADLPAAGRRRLHDAVARALLDAGGDPVAAAGQLNAARARTAAAAQVYRAAADRIRFDDPAAALTWYDDAIDAGADPVTLAAGRAEAAALLGRPVEIDALAGPAAHREAAGAGDAGRLALATGAVAAQQGRADRVAEALLAAAPPGPVLAVPALMATGRTEEAGAAAAGPGPVGLRRTAEAALAVGDPATALPLLIEAAEALEDTPVPVVLPDTPHALAAIVAVTAGDVASAEHLLERAMAAGVGGPVAGDRHRVLLAWARMRAGRYDTAVAELRRLRQAALPGRERQLVAALSAGIARRSGDIARLREAWAGAEPVLARQAIDLFQLEPIEELLVAAARLGEHRRIGPVLGALDGIVDRLGRPPAWAASLEWIRVQVAAAGEDAPAAAAAASALSATSPLAGRQQAQCVAADRWARVLGGDVEPDGVLETAEELAAAQLPWEASRLVGHAAIRTADPPAARRLLERARDLANLANLDGIGAGSGPGGSRAGLSDREVEVAHLVLAGRTHREIGAQLYLSPKTVEHHVARIRTKLGATSRAELVAGLREVLGDHAPS